MSARLRGFLIPLHLVGHRLHQLHAHELRVAGVLAIGYGALELPEGAGLWHLFYDLVGFMKQIGVGG